MEILSYLPELSVTSWILLLWLLWLATWYVSTKPWLNLPPGPPSFPIVGSIPFLGNSDFRKAVFKLSQKYGEVFSLTIGPARCVVLNGHDVIKDALLKNGSMFAARPTNFILEEYAKKKGISTNFGESLQTQRRFVLHVLRDFGLGKSTMDDIIMEEATNLMDEFQRNVNQKYDPHFSLKKAAANIINVLAFGERRDYNDAKFVKSMQLVIDIFQAMGGGTARSFFPFLRFVPGDLFGFKQYRSDINELKSQFQGWIDQHKRMLAQGEEPTDLIGRYLIEIDKTKDDETTYFTEDQLVYVIADLFLAATDTSSTTMYWLMLYLGVYSDIQDNLYQEIADVVGTERSPLAQDRNKLPYTEAVIAETMRRSAVVPFALPHAPVDDVIFRGYLIPKGTTVMPNMYSIDMDPNIWPDPDKFDPERHLTESGMFKKRDEQIPFSIGKRSCPGEGLARKEIFFFLTNIIQKYRIRFPEGSTPPSTEGAGDGAIYTPDRFHVVLENRV